MSNDEHTAASRSDSEHTISFRGGIFKLFLMSPGTYSKESIPPAYVGWRPVRQPLFLRTDDNEGNIHTEDKFMNIQFR
jgi:hypothetical protein